MTTHPNRGSDAFDRWCRRQGLSNYRAADEFGCSNVSILEWRRASKVPSARYRIRIRGRARIPIEWWDEAVVGDVAAEGRV